ncbi:MAG: IclR family transcriptional regulator, partial [Candidatus Adiutrix sp.]|nr:IclR family transcriptional regulator [Candidatus Adiutrix sp.]
VNLGILDRDKIIYLDKVESQELLRMDSGVGTSCQAYITALGKAILAFLPEGDLDAYFERLVMLDAMTPNTITNVEKLRKALARVRKNGYAVDNEELAAGLYCVGAPILDFNAYPAYALSVSGPSGRIKPLKNLPGKIIECAAKLSRQLGCRKVQPGLQI